MNREERCKNAEKKEKCALLKTSKNVGVKGAHPLGCLPPFWGEGGSHPPNSRLDEANHKKTGFQQSKKKAIVMVLFRSTSFSGNR
jgi:hypothetical protein